MIINVRGISGSGKSTLARAVMSYYPEKTPRVMLGVRHPLGYFLKGVEGAPPLYVPGHYETPCGGCDTMPNSNSVALRIFTAHDTGMNVLFEGAKYFTNPQSVLRLVKAQPNLVVISLTTPVDVCADNLRKRRGAIKKEPKVDIKRLESLNTQEARQVWILKNVGVDVRPLVYEDALDTIKKLFKL